MQEYYGAQRPSKPVLRHLARIVKGLYPQGALLHRPVQA